MLLPERCIEIARDYLGVREEPPKSNRGPDVDRFISVGGGLTPEGHHYAWCASFVSDVVIESYTRTDGVELDVQGPPMFKPSPAALGLLHNNPALRIKAPVAGCIFVIDHGGGKGHTGFVVEVLANGTFVSIEGNTGPGPASPVADREGDGVYLRRDRRIADCCGFIKIA